VTKDNEKREPHWLVSLAAVLSVVVPSAGILALPALDDPQHSIGRGDFLAVAVVCFLAACVALFGARGNVPWLNRWLPYLGLVVSTLLVGLVLNWGSVKALLLELLPRGPAPVHPAVDTLREALFKDFVDAINASSTAMSEVQDQASAEAATATLNREAERVRKLAAELKKLGRAFPQEGIDRGQYGAALTAAAKKFRTESGSLRERLVSRKVTVPGEVEVDLGLALQNFSLAMKDLVEAGQAAER
jgi:hypothetical protein